MVGTVEGRTTARSKRIVRNMRAGTMLKRSALMFGAGLLLAPLAHASGAVHVWRLPWKLTQAAKGEAEALEASLKLSYSDDR